MSRSSFNDSYYEYDALLEKAMSAEATQTDIDALGNWFENWGNDFWNGEYFEIDKDHRLYPVYEEIENEDGTFDLKGFEIR